MQNVSSDESSVFTWLPTALAHGAPEKAGCGDTAPRNSTGQAPGSGAHRAGGARGCRSSGDSTGRSGGAVIPNRHPEPSSRGNIQATPCDVPARPFEPRSSTSLWLQIKATES